MKQLPSLSRYRTLLPLALLTAVGCFFLLSGTSAAATINVTSTDNPTPTNDADCTLREAIENINTQTNAVNTDCAAGDGLTDTIIIPSGNIILEADLPQITTSMIIQGDGMDSTVIDGGGLWRVFDNDPSATSVLTLSDMTLTGYRDFVLLSLQGSVDIQRIEIDGAGASFVPGPGSAAGAMAIQNPTNSPVTVNLQDVYVHDIAADTSTMFGIIVAGGGNTPPADNINLTVNNLTVFNLTNTGAVIALAAGFGALNGGQGTGVLTATVSNTTITNITSSTDSAVGLAVLTVSDDKISTLTVRNITIGNLSGTAQNFVPGAAIAAVSAGNQSGATSTSNLIVSNAVLFNAPANCGLYDISGISGSDPGIASITSTGGNLSDDASCAPYFTQPTDQNNVAALAASLLPLADNGGDVPTMALKEGSPAVDSGITVSGLTTDARQAARPQGSAYDSGAYESPYTKPAAELAKSGQGIRLALIVAGFVLVILGLAVVYSKHPIRKK